VIDESARDIASQGWQALELARDDWMQSGKDSG
jgi:hypothetical protein